MHAAIYARKSTEQKGKTEKAKSVPQQIEAARQFIAKKGWTLNEAHIYSDDDISGAEFERRPGFQALMAASRQRTPPFQVLVVRELARLGREAAETGYTVKQLAKAGVDIVEFLHGKSLTPKNWLEKAMSGLQSAADEAHREASRDAVHAAHTSLFRAGKVVGGRVFGYHNRVIYNGIDRDGNPLRSHVEREINPDEAAVVRRIFEMYDSGYGLKRIAKLLTSEKAPRPRPPQRNDGLLELTGWSPSTVRSVLSRETYRGVAWWNKTKKKNDWGESVTTPRPESEWQAAHVEHLRIIDDALWRRVQARRTAMEGRTLRFADGRMSGRPPKHATQNLLAGLATCAVCGGGLIVDSSLRKSERIPQYVCHRARANGSCTNRLRVPVADMNEAVLQAIEEHALTPEAVESVIQLTERDDAQEHHAALTRERKDVDKRIARLVAAVEAAGDVTSLAMKLRELEARRAALDAQLQQVWPLPRLAPKVVEDRLAEWRRLLRQSVMQGRAVVQRVVPGRITFTPVEDGYTFEAPTRFDKLFSGIVFRGIISDRPDFVPTGGVPAYLGAAVDADYGKLLETALKGWRARQDSNLWPSAPEADALSS